MKELNEKLITELKGMKRIDDRGIGFITKTFTFNAKGQILGNEVERIISLNENNMMSLMNLNKGMFGYKIGNSQWTISLDWVTEHYFSDEKKKDVYIIGFKTNVGIEKIAIHVKKDNLPVYDKFIEIVTEAHTKNIEKQKSQADEKAKLDKADKILEQKKLLDAGIITQEEFDAKKKELLG